MHLFFPFNMPITPRKITKKKGLNFLPPTNLSQHANDTWSGLQKPLSGWHNAWFGNLNQDGCLPSLGLSAIQLLYKYSKFPCLHPLHKPCFWFKNQQKDRNIDCNDWLKMTHYFYHLHFLASFCKTELDRIIHFLKMNEYCLNNSNTK